MPQVDFYGGGNLGTGGSSLPAPRVTGQVYTGFDKLGMFGLSALESIPELFGIRPGPDVESFRAANPVSGFASQIAGAFIPYMGAAKALKAVPLIGAGLGALEGLGGSSAIARGALAALGEAGTVEAARLGLAATPVPGAVFGALGADQAGRTESLGDLAAGSALNILVGGAFGAGAGALTARLAKGLKIHDIVPEAAPDRPLLVQIRALNDVIKRAQDPEDALKLPEDLVARLARERDQRIRYNLSGNKPVYSDSGEIAYGGGRIGKGMFRALEGDNKTGRITRFLNNASVAGTRRSTTENRNLLYDPMDNTGFPSQHQLEETIDRIGIGREELASMAQDIKIVRVKEGEGKLPEPDLDTQLTNALSQDRLLKTEPAYNKRGTPPPAENKAKEIWRNFMASKVWAPVDNGWRMAKEKNGMFVFNKLIKGDLNNPAPGDEWIFLRTDKPEFINPRAAGLQAQTMRSAYFPEQAFKPQIGEPIWDNLSNILQLLGKDLPDTVRMGTKSKTVSMLKDAAHTAGTYAAPTAMLGTRNPVLNLGLRMIDSINALSEARISTLMYGTQKMNPKKSAIGNVLSVPETTEGLDAFIKSLSKEEREMVKEIEYLEVPFDVVESAHARGIIPDNVFNFFLTGQALSDDFVRRLGQLEGVVGPNIKKTLKAFAPRKGHYMLTRDYPGSYTILLQDDAGHWIGQATGKDWDDAAKVAQDIIKQEAGRGRAVHMGGRMDEVMRTPEELQKMRAALRKPGFVNARGEGIGYAFQRGELTAKDLSNAVARNLRMREAYIRDIALREQTAELVGQLARTSPEDAKALTSRLRINEGDEGEFGRAQNAIVDKTLSVFGLTGKNSATEIVRGIHKLLGAWTFGFGSLPQVVFNLTGALQTLGPELAFIAKASPETVARNYASLPVFNSQGRMVGAIDHLNPWKVLKNSMELLFTPFEKLPQEARDLVEELVRRRKIAPQYMESSFGSNGALLKNPREAFEHGHSVMDVFNAANELAISKTEEINRMMTAMAAYEVGKSNGLAGERLVYFAEDLIAKTNYNYQTVDRATMYTTPLGSLAGTFKNWMFHYMGSMLRYAGAGKEGRNALLWQTAATALLGGAAATPLVLPLANGFSKYFANQSAMDSIYELTGNLGIDEHVADGLMYGLPGMLGISLSSQVAAPGADPERDAQMMFSLAGSDRMKALGSGFGDAYETYLATGRNPFTDSRVRDQFIRALAPRTLYRVMATAQDGALRSMATGNPVIQNLGFGDAALYGMGFNPTELDKTYAVYNEIRDSQTAKREMVRQLGEALAQALENGDGRAASSIYLRASAIGVDASSVLRSAKSRMARREETQLDFVATPEDQARYGYMFDGQ